MLNNFCSLEIFLNKRSVRALGLAFGLCVSISATAESDLNRFSSAVQTSQAAFASQIQTLEQLLQSPNTQPSDSLFGALNEINFVKNQNIDPASFGVASQKTGERIKNRVDYINSQLVSLTEKIKTRDLAASIDPYSQSLTQMKEQIHFLEEESLVFSSITEERNRSTQNGLPIWIAVGFGALAFALTVSLIRTFSLLRKESAALNHFQDSLGNLERANKEALKQIQKLHSNSSDSSNELQNLDHQVHDLMNQENVDEINRILKNNDDLEELLQKLKSLIYKAVATASADSENLAVINDLVKFVEEISTKTKVIHDIAFKTKVLSFNASVEAERAGAREEVFLSSRKK